MSFELNDEEKLAFAANQQRHRERFRQLKVFGDFASLSEIAQLTNVIGNTHFNKSSQTRFERELALLGYEDALDNFIARSVVLEHSECSETIEEARLPERSFENLLTEQADVLIRTLNLMTNLLELGQANGILAVKATIADYVANKVEKNIERPYAHGGKRF